MERNSDRKNGTLERRFDEARLTYYDAGENACGSYDSGSDFVCLLFPAEKGLRLSQALSTRSSR